MTILTQKIFFNVSLQTFNQLLKGNHKLSSFCWLRFFFAGGHVLLEDLPGTGKTTLAKTLAKSVDTLYGRLQFTPDLLPSDILGVSIYRQHSGVFEYIKGPVFTNILLADEINRASPRTQSALLEAMEERQVTVEGKKYNLGKLFFVIATQNPIESHGTYPFPESQMDHFMIELSPGYLDRDAEATVLTDQLQNHPFDEAQPVTSEKSDSVNNISTINISTSLHFPPCFIISGSDAPCWLLEWMNGNWSVVVMIICTNPKPVWRFAITDFDYSLQIIASSSTDPDVDIAVTTEIFHNTSTDVIIKNNLYIILDVTQVAKKVEKWSNSCSIVSCYQPRSLTLLPK